MSPYEALFTVDLKGEKYPFLIVIKFKFTHTHTGLKCIAKDEDSGVPFVEECLKGHVGCVAAWDCKDQAASQLISQDTFNWE
jgi:hypothetical protein